jgi:hypothetical protein
LESARLAAIADLNGLRQEILESSHEETRRLGFADYPTFFRNLSGIDLVALRELTRPILLRSRDMYEEALSWYLPRWAGTSPRQARRHDLVRLFRAPDLDKVFPPDGLRAAAGARVDLHAAAGRLGGRIRVDESRTRSSSSSDRAGARTTTPRICTSWATRCTSPTPTPACRSSIAAWAIPR